MNIPRNIGGAIAGLILWSKLEHTASFMIGPGQILDLGEEFSFEKLAAFCAIGIITGCVTRMIANGILAIHLLAFILFIPLCIATITIPFNQYSPRTLPASYVVLTLVGIYLGSMLWVFIDRTFITNVNRKN